MRSATDSARRYAVAGGLGAAILFAAGNAIWALDMPEDGTPVPEVVDFYSDTADRIVIGGSLSMLAIAVFVLFAAAVRQVLIDAGDEGFLATTAFGGAVLGMTAGMGAESINLVGALRARDSELNDALAQSLFEVSQILGSAASGVGVGLFALATGVAAIRARSVLPPFASIVTLVIGAILMSPLSHVNWVAGAGMVVLGFVVSIGLVRGGSVVVPLPTRAPPLREGQR